MAGLLSHFQKGTTEAGCDEAGRGCLAGPVFAAAVILPVDFYHPLLNDSKKMNEKHRGVLREVIEKEALAWSVAMVGPEEIDSLNILWASIKAMHIAVAGLAIVPQFLLVDGNRFKPYEKIPHRCFVKGDARFASIAAASVLAKTHRDQFMAGLHQTFPQYEWLKNKGYPTKEHREAIFRYGPCVYHRKSFQLLKQDYKNSLFPE